MDSSQKTKLIESVFNVAKTESKTVIRLLENVSLQSAGFANIALTISRPQVEIDWILDKYSLILSEVYSLKKLGVIRPHEIKDVIQDGWIAVIEGLCYIDWKYNNAQICSYLKTFIHKRLVNKWIREPLAKKRMARKERFDHIPPTDSCENEVIERVTLERIVVSYPSLIGSTKQSRSQALKRLINRKIY